MKLRILVFALITALGTGCATTEKARLAYQVKPVSTVSHGTPNAQSFYQLARYYHGQKRLAQAEEAYLTAIAMDSRQVDAYNALGSLYAERGELKRSVEQFEMAAAIAPEASYIYNNLGFAYYLQGRLDEAYAAVRKAVALDATLERGWANLEQIAKVQSNAVLVDVVKLRQLDALPATLLANSDRDKSASEPIPGTVIMANAAPTPAVVEPKLELPRSSSAVVGVSAASPAAQDSEMTVPALVAHSAVTVLPAQNVEANIEGGKFVLVSTSREVVNLAGPVTIAKAEPPPVEPTQPAAGSAESLSMPVAGLVHSNELEINISSVRFEVSNANGVNGFARKFGAQLRKDSIPVSRITNHFSYFLKETVIEYQPGFEDAARTLMSRTKLDAHLAPAKGIRPRSDVRILLGRNALPSARTTLVRKG